MLIRRAMRFAVTGVFVTLVHIAVATAWMQLARPTPALANAVAFLVATGFSYVINTLWSFSSGMGHQVLFKFFVVSLVGLSLSAGVSHGVDLLGFSYPYGIAAVVCVMPPVNFLLHNFWTYRQSRIPQAL